MDTFDWRLLKVLHETHNITKASQSLYLSQPTLTKRLQQIESEFETELFVRHSRGITFTPKGLLLVEKATQILNEYEELKDRLNSFTNSDVTGTLRIAANAPFARGELPFLVSRFHELYPNVQFDIHTYYSERNYYKLCNGELPLGFIRENYSWPHHKLLIKEEKIYIISRDPFHLEDLKNMNEIHSRFSLRLFAQLEQWWSSHFDIPLQSFITVEDSSIAVEYVKRGLGFTILPDIVIYNRKNEFYRLPLIDAQNQYITRQTWLYYRDKSLENPVVQLFISFMEQYQGANSQSPDSAAPPGDIYTAYKDTLPPASIK